MRECDGPFIYSSHWIVTRITWIQNLWKHPSPQWWNNCFCTVMVAVYIKTTVRVSHKNKWNTWNTLIKEFMYSWNYIVKVHKVTKTTSLQVLWRVLWYVSYLLLSFWNLGTNSYRLHLQLPRSVLLPWLLQNSFL